MKLILVLFAMTAYGGVLDWPASRIRRGAGAPSAGQCTVANDVGKVYVQSDYATTGSPIFTCSNTGVGTWGWQQASSGGGGSIGGSIATSQICYGSASNTCAGSAGLTFTDAANVRLTTLAGGSSQSTNALLDITNSAGSSHWLTVLGDGKVGIGTNAPATPFDVRTAAVGTSPQIASFLAPSTTVGTPGTGPYFNVGVSTSAQNSAAFQFTYIGAGSASNFLAMGIYGTASKLNLFSTGVGIGTSGSIPPTNGLIVGGTTGIGHTTPAAATTLSVLDATAASGATATWIGHDGSGTYSGVHLSALATSLKVVAGLTQGSANLQEWQNSSGTVLASISTAGLSVPVAGIGTFTVDSNGASFSSNGSFRASTGLIADTSGLSMKATGLLAWSSAATWFGAAFDTSLSRCTSTAGCVAVGTGTAGSTAGTLRAQLIQPALSTVTFSATPTFDLSLGNTVKITLTANVTSSTWSNQRAGQETTMVICQNGTGGFTFAFPAATLGAFTIGSTASKCSTQKFVSDGTNLIAQGVGTIDI